MSKATSDGHHAVLAVASRRRLLDLVQAADEPMDGASLAEAIGLHLTTTRFHLQVLERAGLVQRTVERGGRAGRPRQLFSAVGGADPAQSYRQLAEVLVGALADDADGGGQRAEEAGRRWAAMRLPMANLSWDDGTRRVEALFDRIGFGPHLCDDEHARHVELDACPFRDLARAYPQVVCAVHAGLLRGALTRLNVPAAERARLRPFVEAELCIADIPRPADGEDPASSPMG
ncbi:MAG: helix-turn-helix domain-containing protein [Microlunatus sp.]|nr:helix-turn-helix domain-containing protein [Microlunatus sp.]